MLKVWKNIQKLQYGILAKHMMGHDAQNKNIHKQPKVVSCVYTLIVEVVPRNLGVGVSWWVIQNMESKIFGLHIF